MHRGKFWRNNKNEVYIILLFFILILVGNLLLKTLCAAIFAILVIKEGL